MFALHDIPTLYEAGLLSLLVLFIAKSGADHAWHLSFKGCVERSVAYSFIRTWCEPHNAITLTQWPFYLALILLGCSPLSVAGVSYVTYSGLFQPLVNAAHGHPYFYSNEIGHWSLFGLRIPKPIRGSGRVLKMLAGAAMLTAGLL